MNDRRLFYIKFETQKWLDRTEGLSLEERGALIDLFAHFMHVEHLLPNDPTALRHKLRVSTRSAARLVDALVASGHLIRTEHGLSGPGWEEMRAERLEKYLRKKKEKAEISAQEPPENPLKYRASGSQESEKPREINRRGSGVWRKIANTKIHHPKEEINNNESSLVDASVSGPEDKAREGDDDHYAGPKRSISATVMAKLVEATNPQRALDLQREYLASDCAKNAQFLDRAFIGWLKKAHRIQISLDGDPSIEEIRNMCGNDENGRPNLKLPSAEALRNRRSRR